MQNETMHCPSVLCAKEFVCCSCIQCQTTADSLLQIPDVSRSTYSCIAYSQWCEILCFKSQMFLDQPTHSCIPYIQWCEILCFKSQMFLDQPTHSCIAYSQWCEILCFKSQMFLDLQLSFFSTVNLLTVVYPMVSGVRCHVVG